MTVNGSANMEALPTTETTMLLTRTRALKAVGAAILGVVAAVAGTGYAPAQAAIGSSFTDNFDSFATNRWHKADGYSNGSMFNTGWRADHVWFNGGVMGLNLDTTPCPGGCAGKPYASGEYRTNDLFTYGRSEEHTSELQSHVNIVCRLLLEKQKP